MKKPRPDGRGFFISGYFNSYSVRSSRAPLSAPVRTVFQIPWTFLGTELCDLNVLKEKGFVTISAALTNETIPVDDPRLKLYEKKAVLMGSEKTGLAAKTIEESDYTVKIPMFHEVDSLNVAAASAVVFWELGKCGSV